MIQPYNASPVSPEFFVYLAVSVVLPFVWVPICMKWEMGAQRVVSKVESEKKIHEIS